MSWVSVPAPEGVDMREVEAATIGGVDFVRLDPDEAWEMRGGRIDVITRGGARYVRERPRDWDCAEVD